MFLKGHIHGLFEFFNCNRFCDVSVRTQGQGLRHVDPAPRRRHRRVHLLTSAASVESMITGISFHSLRRLTNSSMSRPLSSGMLISRIIKSGWSPASRVCAAGRAPRNFVELQLSIFSINCTACAISSSSSTIQIVFIICRLLFSLPCHSTSWTFGTF